MKATAIGYILLAIGIAVAIAFTLTDPKHGLDPLAEGSHSHLLKHELSFRPGSQDSKAAFVATLTNTTKRNLKIVVEDKEFQGAFEVAKKDGDLLEAYPASYYGKYITAVWSDPTHSLPASASITWVIPISTLVITGDADMRVITEHDLDGATVTSRMERVAVIPDLKGYVTSNAMQRPAPTSLPTKGEQGVGLDAE